MATAVLPAYTRELDPTHACCAPSALSQPPLSSCPSPQPPTYSTQPQPDEETVAFTPRTGESPPQGHFIRQWPQATLILKDQDPESRLPTYGRGGRIVGELGLTNPDKIERVTIKLTGQMSLSVADSGSTGVSLISDSYLLWKNPHPGTHIKTFNNTKKALPRRPGSSRSDTSSSGGSNGNNNDASTSADAGDQKCPSILPIYIPFPQSYQVDGKQWRLPPSFEVTFLGIPALFVRCMYTLSVTITRMRSYHLASWTTSKTYITMLNFRPRTRPHRPIVLLDSVYASIKPVPDEWFQVVTNMNVRPKAGVGGIRPIECHMFIPSTQTFALTDSIPFHLQLTSSLKSFRELLPPWSELLRTGSEDDTLAYKPGSDPRLLAGAGDLAIRVTIARQVVVEVNGRRRFRTFLGGVGKLRPVAPPESSACHAGAFLGAPKVGGKRKNSPADRDKDRRASGTEAEAAEARHGSAMDEDEEVSLDWHGEVTAFAEVTSGGFSTHSLLVKDFLVLSLSPPNPRSSPLIPLQLSHPIRLVTDAWVDVDALHPGDR